MVTSLSVILWGEEVGRLAWDAQRRRSYFIYNPDFVKRGLNITPLTAPVKGSQMLAPIWGEESSDYQGLPAFLSDALPEGWGRQLLDIWILRNNLTKESLTPLDILSLMGNHSMGSFEFIPSHAPVFKGQLDMLQLSDLVSRIRQEGEKAVLTHDDDTTLQALMAVGASTRGRQPKMAVAINRQTEELSVPTAHSLIARKTNTTHDDSDDYLLKWGDSDLCLAEIEMAYYAMAVKAGIRMMPSGFYLLRCDKHFITRRFDRMHESKILVQSLAAMNPQAHSYEQLIATCRQLRLPESDCQEVFRRMVFNYLANNTDDHPRKFSFLMHEDGTWQLSPAYDLTPVFDPVDHQHVRKHHLSLGGQCEEITPYDLLRFARENGIRRSTTILHDVVNALRQFRSLAQKFGVSEIWTNRIKQVLDDLSPIDDEQ